MRGVIYCVHLEGVGHLKRMLTLAEGLVKDCKITLIQAGRDEDFTFMHPNFRHLVLPFPEEGLSLLHRNDRLTLEKILKYRRKQLFSMMNFFLHYDFLITEQIPFTKLAFYSEVLSLKSAMKVKNPQLATICSQKGGTPYQERNQEKVEWMWSNTLSKLQENYDKVLVHCDPQVTTLDEMFGYCDEIREMIEYTGYIFPHGEKYPPSNQREKVILVTTGSGTKGVSLLLALIQVVPKITDYRFVFVISPMMREDIIQLLRSASKRYSHVEVINFLDNFDKKLRQCSLAITLAGSTLINLYATGTPGLTFPESYDKGQVVLGEKFAQHGIVNLIQQEELNPEQLYNKIIDTLKNPPKSDIELNLSGVENSLKAIRQVVQEKRSLATSSKKE